MIDQSPIAFKGSTKILGVIFDAKLNYNEHIDLIAGKMAAATAMLLRLKLFGFPRSSLILAFRALLLPHLYYCASIWQATSKANIKKLQTLQNKALRLIYNLGYRASTSQAKKDLRILSVQEIINFSIAKFIFSHARFRNAHPLISPLFSHHFGGSHTSRAQEHGDLYVWAFASETRRRSIYVSGIRAFNHLPLTVRNATSLWSFKSRFRKGLMEAQGQQ
jgi:hypothetical protein